MRDTRSEGAEDVQTTQHLFTQVEAQHLLLRLLFLNNWTTLRLMNTRCMYMHIMIGLVYLVSMETVDLQQSGIGASCTSKHSY